MPETYRKRYIPLESNPDIFTHLIHKLGVSPDLALHDVLSLDEPDLMSMIPRPVIALILLFPTTEAYEQEIAKSDVSSTASSDEEDVMWFKQTIHNACGLYGLLHAVSNGAAKEFIKPNSPLANLLATCEPLGLHDRALALEDSEDVEAAYAEAAAQGDSEVPGAEDEVDFHYVCFVKSHKTAKLYEMDGDKQGPLYKHVTLKDDEDLFCEDVLGVVRKYIEREKGTNVNFSLMALAYTPQQVQRPN